MQIETTKWHELLELVHALSDAEACHLDHHGYCQTHFWFHDGLECPNARALRLLAHHGYDPDAEAASW